MPLAARTPAQACQVGPGRPRPVGPPRPAGRGAPWPRECSGRRRAGGSPVASRRRSASIARITRRSSYSASVSSSRGASAGTTRSERSQTRSWPTRPGDADVAEHAHELEHLRGVVAVGPAGRLPASDDLRVVDLARLERTIDRGAGRGSNDGRHRSSARKSRARWRQRAAAFWPAFGDIENAPARRSGVRMNALYSNALRSARTWSRRVRS